MTDSPGDNPENVEYEDEADGPPTDASPDEQSTNRWRWFQRETEYPEETLFRVRDRVAVRREQARTEAERERIVPTLSNADFTLEDYEQLLHQQGGVCGCCGQQPTGTMLRPDYRDDGIGVHGLLCDQCLDLVRTVDYDRLANALRYVVRRALNA